MFSIIAVCVINLVIGVVYIVQIRRRQISPALAMWVFFTIAVIGSLVTYLSEGDFSPWDNILNSADLFLDSSVSIAILLYGDRSTRFNRFDIGCLIARVPHLDCVDLHASARDGAQRDSADPRYRLLPGRQAALARIAEH
ncbi:hypothetical protein ACFLS5_00045 [Candidatus Bipolaricaulota bacterium]